MKHFYFLLLTLISLFTTQSFAQGLFITFDFGYGIGVSEQTQFQNSEITFADLWSDSYAYENTKLKLGSGIKIGASVGYMFNEKIGLQLNFLTFSDNKNTGLITSEIHIRPAIDPQQDYINYSHYTLNMSQVIPSFIFNFGEGKFRPYSNIGPAIGFAKITVDRYRKYSPTGNKSRESKQDLSGSPVLGYYLGIGVKATVTKNINAFGEFNLTNMIFTPKKAVYTNHYDLESLTTNEKETIFVDSIDTGGVVNDYEAKEELAKDYSLSSTGVKIGVMYSF